MVAPHLSWLSTILWRSQTGPDIQVISMCSLALNSFWYSNCSFLKKLLVLVLYARYHCMSPHVCWIPDDACAFTIPYHACLLLCLEKFWFSLFIVFWRNKCWNCTCLDFKSLRFLWLCCLKLLLCCELLKQVCLSLCLCLSLSLCGIQWYLTSQKVCVKTPQLTQNLINLSKRQNCPSCCRDEQLPPPPPHSG